MNAGRETTGKLARLPVTSGYCSLKSPVHDPTLRVWEVNYAAYCGNCIFDRCVASWKFGLAVFTR